MRSTFVLIYVVFMVVVTMFILIIVLCNKKCLILQKIEKTSHLAQMLIKTKDTFWEWDLFIYYAKVVAMAAIFKIVRRDMKLTLSYSRISYL
jgi:hypothetical protein